MAVPHSVYCWNNFHQKPGVLSDYVKMHDWFLVSPPNYYSMVHMNGPIKKSSTHCLPYTALSFKIRYSTCKCERSYVGNMYFVMCVFKCTLRIKYLNCIPSSLKIILHCRSEVRLSTKRNDICQWARTGVSHFGVEAIHIILKAINHAFHEYVHPLKQFPWTNSDCALRHG